MYDSELELVGWLLIWILLRQVKIYLAQRYMYTMMSYVVGLSKHKSKSMNRPLYKN